MGGGGGGLTSDAGLHNCGGTSRDLISGGVHLLEAGLLGKSTRLGVVADACRMVACLRVAARRLDAIVYGGGSGISASVRFTASASHDAVENLNIFKFSLHLLYFFNYTCIPML